MSWAPIIQSSLEWAWRIFGVATHVRVRSHHAAFTGPAELSGEACYFITVTNLSLSRDIELTHAWFEAPSGQVAAIHPRRPLPVRLQPQQIWETWVSQDALFQAGARSDIEGLSRVRLSDGRIVHGKRDPHVPHQGSVPGGR